MNPQTFSSPPPELHELPHARSRFGLPEDYAKAHPTYEEAERAYHAGKYAEAAAAFMEVARLVKAPPAPTTYSAAFAKMRVAAYEDAAASYRQAELHAEGKQALTAALGDDAENAELLKRLLARFG